MSFSNIALQQREKESKALRIFLACSLAGSLLFHLALLASGIVKYLNRVPEIEEEPVEITLLDTPIEEIEPKEEPEEEEKPKPEPEKIEPKQEKPEPEPNITQDTTTESQISGGSQAPQAPRLFEPIPTQPRVAPPPPVVEQPPLPKLDIPPIKPISPPVVQQQPVIPEPPKPIPQPEPEPLLKSTTPEEFSIPTTPPIEQPSPIPQPQPKFTTPPIEQPSPIPQPQPKFTTPPIEQPSPIPQPQPQLTTPPIEKPSPIPQPQLQTRTPRELTIPTTQSVEQPSPIPQQDNRELIDSLKQSQENSQISSNNTPPSLPDTSNSNSNTSDTPTRRRRIIGGSNIATAPSTGIGDGTGDSVGDGDGRAACSQCDTSYPSWARQRKIEGQISVAVNADAQGNVTDVRLISGSGNSRLDKYHLRLAKNWKLKPSSNGRQGVIINTTYRIE